MLKNSVSTTEDTEDTEKIKPKLLCDLRDLCGKTFFSSLLRPTDSLYSAHLMRKRHQAALILGGVLAAGASMATGSAQAKRPMTFIDLLNIPRVIDPQLSADGKKIAFTLLTADWKIGRRIPQIWRVDTDGTGRARAVTTAEGGVSGERWSPDGSTLAVLGQVKGQAQIELLPAEGGELKALSTHATAPSAIAWAPDGRSLYFLASDARPAAEVERERLRDDVFAFDENYQQQHLWRVDVADGHETRMTDGNYSVLSFKIRSEERRVGKECRL